MDSTPCRICNNTSGNKFYKAREMMLGLKTEFEYMECGQCGCLQLMDPPEDLGKYYPENYYSYHSGTVTESVPAVGMQKVKRALKSFMLDAYLNKNSIAGKFLKNKYKGYYPWIIKNTMNSHSRILDIGCGTGELLMTMYKDGFDHLTGLDPYINNDIQYPSGIHIHKKNPEDLNERFDIIMMHHAFEHMDNPLTILRKMHNLLNPGGYLIIRIPVADSFAWKKYRENWVQLDAPRHAFLHTQKSMKILCDQSGFEIINQSRDSYELQFTGSEKYLRNIPLKDKTEIFSEAEINEFKKAAASLNEKNEGDQACYYLKKRS